MKFNSCASMNTKKTNVALSILFIILTSATCFVFANTARNKNFNGIYMGVAAGGLAMLTDVDTSADFLADELEGGETISSNLYVDANEYQTAGVGEVRMGYGQSILDRPVWLGIEFFGNFADRDLQVTSETSFKTIPFGGSAAITGNLDNELEISLNDTEFGIDLRPGVLLTGMTLLYGRVGAAFNEIDLDTYTHANAKNDFLSEPGGFHVESILGDSDDVVGLRLGIGLEQKLSRHFSITADYIYTDYGDINVAGTSSGYAGDPDQDLDSHLKVSHDVDLTTQSVLLGVNFYPMVKEARPVSK